MKRRTFWHGFVNSVLIFVILVSALAMPTSIANASNTLITWTSIDYQGQTYTIKAVVDSGTDINEIPLDPDTHLSSVHQLMVYDGNGTPVSDFDLVWLIIIAAQNALEFEDHGRTDLQGGSTRPHNFDSLYSGYIPGNCGASFFIRTVFDETDTTNNDKLFRTAFGARGIRNEDHRRRMYQKLILSMVFQKEIQNEFQTFQSVDYENALTQTLVDEAEWVLEYADTTGAISDELIELVKTIVYGTNAVSQEVLKSPAVLAEWESVARNQPFKQGLNKLSDELELIEPITTVTSAFMQGLYINALATEEAAERMELIYYIVNNCNCGVDPQLILAVEDAKAEFEAIQESTYFAIGEAFKDIPVGAIWSSVAPFAKEWGIHFAAKFTQLTAKQAKNL
ncbi:MAG: hypothetical protein K8R77_04965, partial [Anaerolineaceae bacterium]|nr:hypothetical protein [Anaerolineaceae bacterium]